LGLFSNGGSAFKIGTEGAESYEGRVASFPDTYVVADHNNLWFDFFLLLLLPKANIPIKGVGDRPKSQPKVVFAQYKLESRSHPYFQLLLGKKKIPTYY
jgi:hypothetical protein